MGTCNSILWFIISIASNSNLISFHTSQAAASSELIEYIFDEMSKKNCIQSNGMEGAVVLIGTNYIIYKFLT